VNDDVGAGLTTWIEVSATALRNNLELFRSLPEFRQNLLNGVAGVELR
jgi:hypothetical protein